MLAAYILAMTWLLISYTLRFRLLAKGKGFDPSLITFANPLLSLSYRRQSGLLVLGALGSEFAITTIAGGFLLAFVIAAAASHIFSLAMFNRAATQPVIYYLCSLMVGVIFVSNVNGHIELLGVIIFCLQQLYLRWWLRTQDRRYNIWVEHLALKINQRCREVLSSQPKEAQFWILLIATTESIARPAVMRLAERIYFALKHPPVISTGIMQVAAAKPLSNMQSMRVGARQVSEIRARMPAKLASIHEQLKWMAKHYNGSSTYSVHLEAVYPGVQKAWGKISSRGSANAKAPNP